jgi:hypothetical protein
MVLSYSQPEADIGVRANELAVLGMGGIPPLRPHTPLAYLGRLNDKISPPYGIVRRRPTDGNENGLELNRKAKTP